MTPNERKKLAALGRLCDDIRSAKTYAWWAVKNQADMAALNSIEAEIEKLGQEILLLLKKSKESK